MKQALFGLAVVIGVAGIGCAVNPSVGTGIVAAQKYFGDVGIDGNGQNVTVLKGSRVTKLSIIGNNNTVTVEEGAAVYRIEFWGSGNTVMIPDNLWVLRTNNVGRNQIIRRPTSAPPGPSYEFTPEAVPAATPTTPAATARPAPAQPAPQPAEEQGLEEK